MKKIKLIVLFILLSIFVTAQNSNRIASTKIVDALSQFPAQNEKVYNRLMEDIVSTGEEGLSMLLEMINRNDESAVQAQYALGGLIAYISEEDFNPVRRKTITESLQKALSQASDETVKGFLSRQLMILGIPVAQISEEAVLDVKEAAKLLKAATSIAKKDPSELNSANRCKALQQYIASAGVVDGEKVILKALSDPCREYRFAALYAIQKAGPAILYEKIGKLLPKLKNNEARIDIIWWFGEERNGQNASFVAPYTALYDYDLVSSAAWATTKIGSKSTISNVAQLLVREDPKFVELGYECLRCYEGDIFPIVMPLYPMISDHGKVAVINLIAQRRSVANKEVVFDAINSTSDTLRNAAYIALKAVSEKSDVERLCSLLENTQEQNVAFVQEAVLEALSSIAAEDRYNALVERKDAVDPNLKRLYWPMIIASAGMEELYKICSEESNPLAFTTLIDRISKSKLPGEQRLLLLRRAMDFARVPSQKIAVLNSVAGTGTFLGVIFAGKYIEDPELQQAAAQAVRLNAVSSRDFNSSETTALLKRAAQVIKGKDSEYEVTSINQYLESLPQEEGFVSMFNGKDLTGWQGLITKTKDKKGKDKWGYDNPFARMKLKSSELVKAQAMADELMKETWRVEDGNIVFFGKGYDNLCSVKKYGDFEMYLDWFLYPEGPEADAGIYLRATPQVQIWDTARVDVGAQVGSGGLYNNVNNPSKPLCVADNGLGQWNSFYIKMVGERVTVRLNGVLVVDNVILENYWDRSQPIFPIEDIQLQAHGSKVAYRDLYIRELPQVQPVKLSQEEEADGFELLFDGTSLSKWKGSKQDYVTENGTIAVKPSDTGHGNLYTVKEYSDFVFRFEFKLTPGANNGVGIRTPGEGDAAYEGMEIQVLDHYNPIYQPLLKDYQYHGSVYGIIPTQNRDALRPVGEWNEEEIYVKGTYIRVTLNGVVITEGDIAEATKNGTYDHQEHPGLFRKGGFIGFLGHDSQLWYRNVRIKEL